MAALDRTTSVEGAGAGKAGAEQAGFRSALLDLWREASRSDPDLHAVASHLSTVPDVAAATLRFANSAYIGAAYPVGSVLQGVVRVGCRTVGSLVAARLGRSVINQWGDEETWGRALVIGRGAKIMGRLGGLGHDDCEQLFVAGLFAEMGSLMLEKRDARYAQWKADAQGMGFTIDELLAQERLVFGADHPSLGGTVLEGWNLPAQIAAAVAHHHCPANRFEMVLATAMRIPQGVTCIDQSLEDGLIDLGLDHHHGFIERESKMFANAAAAVLDAE